MKKFLSIILALTMVIALIPATFAADEITENDYVFKTSSITGRTTDYNGNRGTWSFSEVDSSKSAPFRVAGCRSIYSNGSMTSQHMNIPFMKSDYSIFDIHIVVTVDGAVQPTLRHKLNTEGINVDLYLYRLNNSEDINLTSTSYDSIDVTKDRLLDCLNGKAHTQHLGTINTYAESWTGTVVPVELNKVNVTPGEYILVCYGKFAEGVADGTQGKAVLDSFNLKKLEEDTELTNAFEVEKDENYSYTAPTMTGLTIGGDVINAEPNADGSYNIEAPTEDKEGDKFLYWVKGMETRKKIISFSNKLVNYVPENNGTNFIIAVYEGDIKDATTPEYYNLNGQLIAKSSTIPALPSIPGLGKAKDWENCGGNIWVAQYEDMVRDNVTVTVDENEQVVAYGTPITCKADETKGTFKCWMKGETTESLEIASVDKTYTFNAWENCTVKAVYEPHNYTGNKMKIIIDTFDVAVGVTGVMAEFIGLDSAVEKGIMFTDSSKNTTKIAMTTKDNQFTVIADETGTYKGYAIVKEEDNSYTLITDGEYTK